ncbi:MULTISPECIES: hypothetical protein [unclassified Streptomyces]|uniref:hypothetical protein n=1 Tax=unclassified Streptomyces TaxID=2593676 RepID=UPI00114D2115|nr:hypothetical protein [Streptomyces sp. MnatMP-M77]MYT83031.1 hypothetical protein [Streptomyces sp. SID8364]
MSKDLDRQPVAYDRAVDIAGSTYPEISRDERGARELAGRQLAQHAPSDRTAANCPACDDSPWPCSPVQKAIKYADPRYN